MSKLSSDVKKLREEASLRLDETEKNFMGGDSYKLNPLETLKMVSASSIFGEPQYYRDGRTSKATIYVINIPSYVREELLVDNTKYAGKTTSQMMETVIDEALNYDFKGVLDWAVELRNKFNMRLNPQVIMVRAALHPKRKEFTESNPGEFDRINQMVMGRADEPMTQMSYYLYNNGGKKNNIPSLLKRSWAKNISALSRYKVAKYKNHEIGMINAVRLCHANSDVIDELMTTGKVEVNEEDNTWENLRSAGKDWKTIFNTINIPHMALLRNLRGIFTEVDDLEFCKKVMAKLKSGVEGGKQFPFRYYAARQALKSEKNVHHLPVILDTLEECMDIALKNFPKLSGKTMCLSDNSGSAWGTFNSEYGTVTVANIDNLSAVITAACSDEGYVGKFGDKLSISPISKRTGVLKQSEEISNNRYNDVGGSTENGIWVFFKNAIDKKEHWDNIFIYSDMQAGHGGLYGYGSDVDEYRRRGYAINSTYINVFKLVQDYRKYVNPNVNVFSVQTAGYTNNILPENAYRISLLTGWTGKEAVFAQEMISQWDSIDKNRKNKNK